MIQRAVACTGELPFEAITPNHQIAGRLSIHTIHTQERATVLEILAREFDDFVKRLRKQ